MREAIARDASPTGLLKRVRARATREPQECNSIKLEWLKTAEVSADDPNELRLVQYVPRGAETARYAHTKAKVAEGALAETTEYGFRAATPQARLLWQCKIKAVAERARAKRDSPGAGPA